MEAMDPCISSARPLTTSSSPKPHLGSVGLFTYPANRPTADAMYRLFSITTVLLIFSIFVASAQHGSLRTDNPEKPGPPQPPAVCPENDDRAPADIETFLEHDTYADIRTEVGLAGASVSDFKPLTNAVDGFICDVLNDRYSDVVDKYAVVSYYKISGHDPAHYLVVQQPDPPEPDPDSDMHTVTLGVSSISVYDQSLTYVGGYAY